MKQELVNTWSLEDVKRALPSKKNAITQEIVDIFNDSINEPEFQGEDLLQTATTYESVLKGRSGVGLKDYVYALKFCAYLMTVDDNYTEAYKKTFMSRTFVRERLAAGTASVAYRELTTAASRYRRSKLVVDILTISQVPLDMLFTGARYRAVQVLAERMEYSKLDRDKIAAAKELLAATKGPENMKIELDVGTKENTATQNLMDQLAAIATRQQKIIESGVKTAEDFGAMVVHDDAQREDIADYVPMSREADTND